MSKLIVLIAIGFGVGIISYLLIKKKTQKLPSINDDLFFAKFRAIYPDALDKEKVIQERRNIAKQLGISSEKLDVEMTFDDLSIYLNILGSYGLAIGDLEQDLSEFFERKQVQKPYPNPSTIGELIYEIVKAK